MFPNPIKYCQGIQAISESGYRQELKKRIESYALQT
jgi:hypothetical protein